MRRQTRMMVVALSSLASISLGRRLHIESDFDKDAWRSIVLKQSLSTLPSTLNALATALIARPYFVLKSNARPSSIKKHMNVARCRGAARMLIDEVVKDPDRARDKSMQEDQSVEYSDPSVDNITDGAPKEQSKIDTVATSTPDNVSNRFSFRLAELARAPLNLHEVINILKAEIPNIFQKEPNWNIYADDFSIKLSLLSYGIFRVLGRLTFVLKDDPFVEVISENNGSPIVVVQWKVQLDRRLNPSERALRVRSSRLELEPSINMETVLSFNERNQVSSVDVRGVTLDGSVVQTWPKMAMRCNPADVWSRVRALIREARPSQIRVSSTLQNAVDIVKNDIVQMFRKEPNWTVFTDDFYIRGSREGLNILKGLEKRLSGNMTLEVKSYTPGDLSFENGGPFLTARWKVRLRRPLNEFEQAFRSFSFSVSKRSDRDLEFIAVEAENVFHFNNNSKVDYMRIDNLIADGRRVIPLPEARVEVDPNDIWARVNRFIPVEPEVNPRKIIRQMFGRVKFSDIAQSFFPLPESPLNDDLEVVVDNFKRDISQLFRKEPKWGIFTEDFYVKISLEGGKFLELIEKRLNATGSTVVLENGFPEFSFKYERGQPFLVARWRFRFPKKLNPAEKLFRMLYDRWQDPFSPREVSDFVSFRCDTGFHFNDKKQIDYMRIENFKADRREVSEFPSYVKSLNPATIYKRVKILVNDTQEADLFNLKDWASIGKSPLNPYDIIKKWRKNAQKSATSEYFQSEVDATRKEIDAASKRKMKGATEILTMIEDDLGLASPDKIIILTLAQDALSREQALGILAAMQAQPAESTQRGQLGSVFAVATTNEERVFDTDGKLQEIAEDLGLDDLDADDDGRVPVIRVNDIASVPKLRGYGFGKELLFHIIRVATGLGRLTILSPANEKLENYYRKVGFERIDDFGADMVYCSSFPEVQSQYTMEILPMTRSESASQLLDEFDSE